MSFLHLFSSLASRLRRPPLALDRRSSLRLPALWLLGALVGLAAPDPGKEYQLKAAFLYNFTRFVEWPNTKLPSGEPLVIGLWQTNPFGKQLEATIGNRTTHGRKILVRTCSSLEEAQRAHVLFIGAAESADLKETVDLLHASHVLTVGESRGFASASGIITFSLEGDKLRFEINLDSGEDAKLKLSAQLLKLATGVRR